VEAIVHPSVLLSPSSARLVPREGVRSTLTKSATRTLTVEAHFFRDSV
jgi:hypothetical protein